jgi:hypothetical protein
VCMTLNSRCDVLLSLIHPAAGVTLLLLVIAIDSLWCAA